MASFENWYLQTPFQDGEIFSSWLIRSSLEVGCSPLTLIDLLWKNWRGLTIDLDKGLDKYKLSVLLKHSNEHENRIKESMLNSYSKHISIMRKDGQKDDWILVLGQRNRSNQAGRQVCTDCFNRHSVPPYLALAWRFGWNIACKEHMCQLIDHCPRCGINFQPFKIDFEKNKSITLCFSCGYDYKNYRPSKNIDKNALEFQFIADEVLRTGEGLYNSEMLNAQIWFTVGRMWLRAIRSLLTKKNKNIILFFNDLDIGIPHDLMLTPLAFEYLNTSEREKLLSILNQIMALPLSKIIETGNRLGISRSTFWDRGTKLPSVLEQFRNELHGEYKKYPKDRKKIEKGKPKTKKQVSSKLLKLIRKNNYMVRL